jgi:crotonobetainyl-CoA:carnitine CoA-transferase CaiB-like acyl-CoA transferase
MRDALDDILILDLSRVLAGPYATMLLSDFGARVIKIEQPGSGDETRQWGPPFHPDGLSAYFISVNRNKESVTLDLKQPAALDVLRDLIRRADVLVENFKTGTLERLGLGVDVLQQLNPQLIVCSISGYGRSGPQSARPGYDTVIQAEAGLMSITGAVDGPPMKVGVAVVDITAGLYAASAILAALHERSRSGRGQQIDIALYDAQLGWLANVASAHLVSGRPPQRYGNAHATIVPYQTFRTADGEIMVAVGNDGQFARFAVVCGRPDWIVDPRYATNPARVANRQALVDEIAAIVAARPLAELVAQLQQVDVPCGPVNDIPTALNSELARARAMVQTIDGIPLVGPVPKLSRTPARIRSAPPQLGSATAQVLSGLLGYDADRLAELRADGAIGA